MWVLILLGVSISVHADTCTGLLLLPKDPKLARAMQNLDDHVFLITSGQHPSGKKFLKTVQAETSFILATGRPQDLPLDFLDQISRQNLMIGNDLVFTPSHQNTARKLLEKQAMSDGQIAKLILEIQTDIDQIKTRMWTRELDINLKPRRLTPEEAGTYDYDLMVLKHILYTKPKSIPYSILLFMSDLLSSPSNSMVRDTAYAQFRVDELLKE
jgi:hypothetical protein